MQYSIRPALEKDKQFIYHLKKDNIFSYVDNIWGWDEDYQYQDFCMDWTKINDFWILETQTCSIGFLQIRSEQGMVNIIELHLSAKYRNAGIGTEIIQTIQQKAAEKQYMVQIGCFKQNQRAKQLYEKLGFVQECETDTHYILKYERKSPGLPQI